MDTLQLTQNGEMLVNLLFEKSIDGIFILDTDFRIIEWNRAMETISGERKEDVSGKIYLLPSRFLMLLKRLSSFANL